MSTRAGPLADYSRPVPTDVLVSCAGLASSPVSGATASLAPLLVSSVVAWLLPPELSVDGSAAVSADTSSRLCALLFLSWPLPPWLLEPPSLPLLLLSWALLSRRPPLLLPPARS